MARAELERSNCVCISTSWTAASTIRRGSARAWSTSARKADVYLRTSAKPLPNVRAACGKRFGPRTSKAITKRAISFSGSRFTPTSLQPLPVEAYSEPGPVPRGPGSLKLAFPVLDLDACEPELSSLPLQGPGQRGASTGTQASGTKGSRPSPAHAVTGLSASPAGRRRRSRAPANPPSPARSGKPGGRRR